MNNLKLVRRLNLFVAGGLSGLYFLDRTYDLENVKNKLELKINNEPAPVPTRVKHLVRDVMKEMALSSEEMSFVKIFVINDFNVKCLGYPSEKFGAFLGVPQYFVLDRMTEFDVIPMVDDTHLSPDSPEAQNFKYLLSLSKEAKKYAIASELYEAKHICFYYIGLLPLFVFVQGNAISFISEKLFKRLGKPLPFFHAFVFLMTVWVYVLLNDLTSVYRRAEAEFLAAKLGPSYVDGGIEYYEKVLDRNKNIKKLDGNAPYTEKGEIKKHLGFRTISLPYERRIMLLKDLKKYYQSSGKKEEFFRVCSLNS